MSNTHIDKSPIRLADDTFGTAMYEKFGPLTRLVGQDESVWRPAMAMLQSYLCWYTDGYATRWPDYVRHDVELHRFDDMCFYVDEVSDPGWTDYIMNVRDAE